MDTDAVLMARIRDRDEAAFGKLHARYADALRRHPANLVRETAAAEDLTQEVFLRVWTRAEQWQGRGEVAGWLYRIATNLAWNHLRALRRRPQQPLSPASPEASEDDDLVPGWMIDRASLRPDVAAEQAEEIEWLEQLIAGLPEGQRSVLLLAREAEMGMKEIADLLAIPEGTVKSRLHSVRAYLARAWKED